MPSDIHGFHVSPDKVFFFSLGISMCTQITHINIRDPGSKQDVCLSFYLNLPILTILYQYLSHASISVVSPGYFKILWLLLNSIKI